MSNQFYNDFVVISLLTEEDPKVVMQRLKDVLNRYGFVTVSDLFDAIGVFSNYEATKYGWTDVSEFRTDVDEDGVRITTTQPAPVEELLHNITSGPRKRVKFDVYVDLDPLPGTFHTKESAQNHIRMLLNQTLSHYNPMISLAKQEEI